MFIKLNCRRIPSGWRDDVRWPGTCTEDERCPVCDGRWRSCCNRDASVQRVNKVVPGSTVFVPHVHFDHQTVLPVTQTPTLKLHWFDLPHICSTKSSVQ